MNAHCCHSTHDPGQSLKRITNAMWLALGTCQQLPWPRTLWHRCTDLWIAATQRQIRCRHAWCRASRALQVASSMRMPPRMVQIGNLTTHTNMKTRIKELNSTFRQELHRLLHHPAHALGTGSLHQRAQRLRKRLARRRRAFAPHDQQQRLEQVARGLLHCRRWQAVLQGDDEAGSAGARAQADACRRSGS